MHLVLHTLEPLKAVRTPTGDTILPLPADHAPGALVFRVIRANGKAFFYGHDSGVYPAATLDALSDGIELDLALLDCTSGALPG